MTGLWKLILLLTIAMVVTGCPDGAGKSEANCVAHSECEGEVEVGECEYPRCTANGCVKGYQAAGTACDDGDPETHNDRCDGYGSCGCQADCKGIECGNDGCGGSCGTCAAGAVCVQGSCTSDPGDVTIIPMEDIVQGPDADEPLSDVYQPDYYVGDYNVHYDIIPQLPDLNDTWIPETIMDVSIDFGYQYSEAWLDDSYWYYDYNEDYSYYWDSSGWDWSYWDSYQTDGWPYNGWDAIYLPNDGNSNWDISSYDFYWNYDGADGGYPLYCNPDQFENDDSPVDAPPIALGEFQDHTICPPGESDYLRFQLVATTQIEICVVNGDFNPMDIFLYTELLEKITQNDVLSQGYVCPIWEEVLDPGAYFIRVKGSWISENPNYTIVLKEGFGP